MSNIYKEVFLAAFTGASADPECNLGHAIDYAESAANTVLNNPEIMAKIGEGETASVVDEFINALAVNKGNIRGKLIQALGFREPMPFGEIMSTINKKDAGSR